MEKINKNVSKQWGNKMSIRFIYGRAGTGKSRFCIDEIKKKLQLDENRKLIEQIRIKKDFI